MLEEDALRFDAFLKENDEKVQEAIKHADTEAKAKQDKVRSAPRDSSTAQPSMGLSQWPAADGGARLTGAVMMGCVTGYCCRCWRSSASLLP